MNDALRSHALRALLASAAVAGAVLTFASPALADDADKAACEGKEEGDACTRGDGGEGTCSIDEDDDVLSCDDDGAAGSGDASDDSSDDGCSVGSAPGAAGSGAWLGAGLALSLLGRRRRRG